METEKLSVLKKHWRTPLIVAAIIFFVLALLLPLDAVSFFVLLISGFTHAFTIVMFLVRRFKAPTRIDLYLVKFGLLIFVSTTYFAFQFLDHAIPE